MPQNIQTELNFSSTSAGETREAGREATESLPTVSDPESPASTNRLMEAVCERENLKEALRRVKANKGTTPADRPFGQEIVGFKWVYNSHHRKANSGRLHLRRRDPCIRKNQIEGDS
jgi:hypothetical protein